MCMCLYIQYEYIWFCSTSKMPFLEKRNYLESNSMKEDGVFREDRKKILDKIAMSHSSTFSLCFL